ncbi:MAG: DedA family protein [Gammaproteobacteria bacterium]|nr:DedA family protein [Gammaproteobacteria bacterium]
MSIKQKIYLKLKSLVLTPYGIVVMALLCFFEACILPITPIVMLLPLILLSKDKTFRYINIATISALFGSIVGYILGYYLILYLEPMISSWGYTNEFLIIQDWFGKYGLLILLPASLIPFPPFKLFTIGAGAMHINFGWFLIVVVIVRWLHFISIPLLLHFGYRAYLLRMTKITPDLDLG